MVAAKKTAKVKKKKSDTATKTSKKTAVKKSAPSKNQVLEKIAALADWRSTVLSNIRALIFEAIPDAT